MKLFRILMIASMSSVYLMQAPCTTKHGMTILPNLGLGILGDFTSLIPFV